MLHLAPWDLEQLTVMQFEQACLYIDRKNKDEDDD